MDLQLEPACAQRFTRQLRGKDGLFGGLAGAAPGDWALPAALVAAGLLIAAGYVVSAKQDDADLGMTSEVAALATVALGAQFDNLLAVTAGTTCGMMLANVPAVLFGEALDRWTLLGAAIILAANAYIAHREAVLARKAATQAPSAAAKPGE